MSQLFENKWVRMKKKKKYHVPELEPERTGKSKLTKRRGGKCCGMRIHTEKEYFWGDAGLVRIGILVLANVSMMLGFPGYEGHDTLYVGYGETNYILASILLNFFTILISYVVILMLLMYAEVRCKMKWHHRNMVACVIQCLLMIGSGLCQFMGIRSTRRANCLYQNESESLCRSDLDMPYPVPTLRLASPYRPPYYQTHYAAAYLKMLTAMLCCIAGRILLTNEDGPG